MQMQQQCIFLHNQQKTEESVQIPCGPINIYCKLKCQKHGIKQPTLTDYAFRKLHDYRDMEEETAMTQGTHDKKS